MYFKASFSNGSNHAFDFSFLLRMTSNFVGDSEDAEVPCKVFVQIQVFQFDSTTAFTAKFQVDSSMCLTCSGITEYSGLVVKFYFVVLLVLCHGV